MDQARAMAGTVVGTLRDPILAGGSEVQVTGRYGLALSAPGVDAATLLRRADSALQEARRDNFTEAVWNEEMAAQRTTALRMTQDLRRALTGDELSLVFQPLVDIASRRPVRAEALLRWNHPVRGAVEPGQFIPLAERSGLISQITPWVLDRALDQAAEWRAAGLDVPVDVNVSAVDLQSGGLAQLVADGLAARDLPPSAICIEITETALVGEFSETINTLESLAHLGVIVSIDDFGTGWSSLAYLKRLPAGEIKLDRSFVGSMGSDPRDAEIVRAAIGLGRALGVQIVAEGVEDEPTVTLLTELGCTLGQGYLFARPMSAAALTAQLRL
jgi:EAL domain-containing protein (putative c-di-GMP-specific phosphodiesterase class I)